MSDDIFIRPVKRLAVGPLKRRKTMDVLHSVEGACIAKDKIVAADNVASSM